MPQESDAPVVIETLLGGVLTLTLNRPERMNAVTIALVSALGAAMERARDNDDVRVVLLTGAGRGFCAGADLSERRLTGDGAPPDLGAALDTYYNPLIRTMRALPKPVIAAVNGPAAGAGANLALACDIVIAARSASFLQAFARIGLIPDAGGTFFLPRLVGEARARALMMLAEPIGAEQAADWGLIYKAVDDDKLIGEANHIAERLALGPTFAYGLMKRAFAASADSTLHAQLDLERDLQREAGKQGEFVEGVRAFLEKRPADFRGARKGAP